MRLSKCWYPSSSQTRLAISSAAGVADLFVLGARLHQGQESGFSHGVAPNCGKYRTSIPLARGLDSVDLETGIASRAAYERSDVTAVAACGVIAEAMLAFVLADALLESTGGDRLEDVKFRLAVHRERVRRYPAT